MNELRMTPPTHSPTNVIGWRLPLDAITRRETEVLQAITDGCSTPQIAARLYLSQKTVKNHLASIYQKLDARDRTQAVLIALRLGIVQLERSDAAGGRVGTPDHSAAGASSATASSPAGTMPSSPCSA